MRKNICHWLAVLHEHELCFVNLREGAQPLAVACQRGSLFVIRARIIDCTAAAESLGDPTKQVPEVDEVERPSSTFSASAAVLD